MSASSNTRARNSLRAVAPHIAPSLGVHGERPEVDRQGSVSLRAGREGGDRDSLLCHWSLDVTFREDESQIRERHLPEKLAWLIAVYP